MPRDTTTKPKNPYAEFPLTAHANGQWCKKIRRKLHFFGKWANADAALQKYLVERDDLQAGRIPQRLSQDVVELGSLAKLFWHSGTPRSKQAVSPPGRSSITEIVRNC